MTKQEFALELSVAIGKILVYNCLSMSGVKNSKNMKQCVKQWNSVLFPQ